MGSIGLHVFLGSVQYVPNNVSVLEKLWGFRIFWITANPIPGSLMPSWHFIKSYRMDEV